MKLEKVEKLLMISISETDLNINLKALDKVIVDNNNQTSEINTLKQFSIELTKILHSVRDY